MHTRSLYLHAYQSYIWNLAASFRISQFGVGGLIVGDQIMAEKTHYDVATDNIVEITPENMNLYSISDVVIPLPGHKINFPNNAVGDYIRSLLAQDGLDQASLSNEGKNALYGVTGNYRRLMQIPSDFSWRIGYGSDMNKQYFETDADLLEGRRIIDDDNDETGKMVVCLEFELPSSTYATMLVRELTKNPTEFYPSISSNIKSKNDDDEEEEEEV